MKSIFKDSSLTEVEVLGMSMDLNLADGHCYLDADKHFSGVTQSLPQLWAFAETARVADMQEHFRSTFARYFSLQGLLDQEEFSIAPTASNSIDIVGAWARANNYRVGLVEPTFDNLALLLRRREVTVVPIQEETFFQDAALTEAIETSALDCVFVVNPNNPTGTVLGPHDIRRLARLCRELDKTLIIDASFRFCHVEPFDDYQILRDEGVSFIVIEDTGKCWPTLDAKASLLSSSPDIAPLLRTIYEEIYLCCSNFSLAFIAAFINRSNELGGPKYIQSLICARRNLIENALSGTPFRAIPSQGTSCMSVVWIDTRASEMTDLELVGYLWGFGLAVLPGRYFFWDSHDTAGHHFVRLALMKPERVFESAVAVFSQAGKKLAATVKAPEKALASRTILVCTD